MNAIVTNVRTLGEDEMVVLVNAGEAKRAAIRALDTNATLPTTSPDCHRLTHAEAVDRAALLAMFDQLDSRGQKTTLAMLAVAVKLHPRS